MRTLVNQLVLTLLILTLCGVWAGKDARAVPLGESGRQRVFGGDGEIAPPKGCIRTTTDCTDPSGIPSTCTYNMKTQQCETCDLAVTNYQYCDFKTSSQYTCTSTTTTSYCGIVRFGTPGMNNECSGKCTKTTDVSCGTQIPTVTGVPCP